MNRIQVARAVRAKRRRGWLPRTGRAGPLPAALLGAAILAVVALLAAGCGGSSSASPTTTSASGSGSAASGQSANATKLVKYAQCMRSHGLSSFPDPVNGKLSLTVTKGGPLDPNSSQYKVAQQACKSLAPAGLLGGSQPSTQQQNKFLAFAQCMRKHGVSNFPDPQSGGFLMQGNIQSNPHFQPALQACRSILGSGALSGSGG